MSLQRSELRVFISSTFRDLQKEREYLIKKIFPKLRTICRLRGVTFTEVDLRWGLTDEQQRLGRIIRTCLEEIDRCRPYFIGIIGKRYGWTPEYHEVMMDPEIQMRYPWIEQASLDGASLLDMEFSHGVLNDGNDSAYFYRWNALPQTIDNPERLEDLVRRVQENGNPLRMFNSLDELGEFVYADLLGVINASWPENKIPTPLERERNIHEAFAMSRRRAYIANPEYLNTFTQWYSVTTTPLVIFAESGMGKSALLACFAGEYRRKRKDSFTIEHYVGASDDSADHFGFMRRVIGEIAERYNLPNALSDISENIENIFPEWLGRVGAVEGFENDELFITLDAVDQLYRTSQSLNWLPKNFPPNVRLVISCREGNMLGKLRERNWREMEIKPLKGREREAIVTRYLGEYHKQLPSDKLQRIGNDEKAASPLFLRTLAEELRLHGEHESLTIAFDHYLGVADLDELFMLTLERMESDYSVTIVQSVLTSLSSSRIGLTETNLLGASGISRADLSLLLHALDYHLLRTGGRLNFFHNYLRRAVERRYLFDPDLKKKSHSHLAAYFLSEFEHTKINEEVELDLTLCREMLYQFSQAEDTEYLHRLLLDPFVFELMFEGETEYEFLEYWRSLGDSDIAAQYEFALISERITSLSSERKLDLRLKQARLLRAVGAWEAAEHSMRDALAIAEDESNIPRKLSGWGQFGDLLMLRGKPAEALVAYQRKLSLAHEIGDQHAEALASGDIGTVLIERGEYEAAKIRFQEMLKICRQYGDKRGISRSQLKIGQIHLNTGNYSEAMTEYLSCAEILESLGERRELAYVFGQIGLVHWNTGAFSNALECFNKEKQTAEQIGDMHGSAMAIGKIGLVELDQGASDSALDCFHQYLNLSTSLGYSRGIGFALGDIGICYLNRGEFEAASEYFEKALSLHREINFSFGIALWLKWKAESIADLVLVTEATEEQLIRAKAWAAESAEISRRIENADILFDAQLLEARLCFAIGEKELALDQLNILFTEHLDDTKKADLLYLMWKFSGIHTMRDQAAPLYRSLSERTKKKIFIDRYKELSSL